MEQYCYKCSEYASICVHMQYEKERATLNPPMVYRVCKPDEKEEDESLLERVIKKQFENMLFELRYYTRQKYIEKYCTHHKFYNAWDL